MSALIFERDSDNITDIFLSLEFSQKEIQTLGLEDTYILRACRMEKCNQICQFAEPENKTCLFCKAFLKTL